MDVLKKIKDLLSEKEWSVYKLSVKSGIPQSTLANMFSRNNLPTIPTLELICNAFGITMSDFFKEASDDSEPPDNTKEMIRRYTALTDQQKGLILELVKNMK